MSRGKNWRHALLLHHDDACAEASRASQWPLPAQAGKGSLKALYVCLQAYTLLAQWLSEDGDIKQRSGAPTPQEFENLDTAAHEAVRHHATD